MARRRKKKGIGGKFKNLKRSAVTDRSATYPSDVPHNTTTNQEESPDREGREANNFQVTEAIRDLCCELCDKRAAVVIAFNAEGGVAFCERCGSSNSGNKIKEAEKMATQRGATTASVMEVYSTPLLAKSPKRHPITRGSSTTRTEKKNYSKDLFARLTTLQDQAAKNKIKMAENEANWEKQEETNLDHSKRIDKLEEENAAIIDELSQFRTEVKELAEHTVATVRKEITASSMQTEELKGAINSNQEKLIEMIRGLNLAQQPNGDDDRIKNGVGQEPQYRERSYAQTMKETGNRKQAPRQVCREMRYEDLTKVEIPHQQNVKYLTATYCYMNVTGNL